MSNARGVSGFNHAAMATLHAYWRKFLELLEELKTRFVLRPVANYAQARITRIRELIPLDGTRPNPPQLGRMVAEQKAKQPTGAPAGGEQPAGDQ